MVKMLSCSTVARIEHNLILKESHSIHLNELFKKNKYFV